MDVQHQTELSADEINRLFDLAIHQLNYPRDSRRREKWIFDQALGSSRRTTRRLLQFLHDVQTCPPAVIGLCQMIIAPRNGKLPGSIVLSLARHRVAPKISLDKSIHRGKKRQVRARQR